MKIFSKICPICGKEFTAQKVSTQYCSHQCASRAYKARKRNERIATVEDLYDKAVAEKLKREFAQREVLSPSQAAKFLSISRNTLYRYIHAGTIPCLTISGLTRIRKEDLSALFTGHNPFIGERLDALELDLSKFWNVSQVSIQFGIAYSAVYRIINAAELKGRRYRGVDYYEKDAVNELFESYRESQHPEITSWYTCKEIMKKYTMTESAVYLMSHDNDVPRKTSGRTVYYSKKHIDAIRTKIETNNKSVPVSALYYSVQMVMEEFGMNEDQVLHFLRRFKIKKDRIGKVIRFKKSDFLKIFDAPPFDL